MNPAKDAYLGIKRSNESVVKNITPKIGCITISKACTAMAHTEGVTYSFWIVNSIFFLKLDTLNWIE